jgi:hypothetical protein
MGKRRFVTGVLMAGAIASGGVALASPALASPAGTAAGASVEASGSVAAAGCVLGANTPSGSGSTVRGYGYRSGCGNTVTYFWVRVYKHIPWWPDSERAVRGATYFQNGGLTASGSCSGRGEYYTHSSTSTGLSGDSRESLRRTLC